MDSANAAPATTNAMIHIQKTAPGPPTAMAVETPTMLPVPTRAAEETAKAWNAEMRLVPSAASPGSSRRPRSIWPNSRNWTPLVSTR